MMESVNTVFNHYFMIHFMIHHCDELNDEGLGLAIYQEHGNVPN
jgi:hypothetical protein